MTINLLRGDLTGGIYAPSQPFHEDTTQNEDIYIQWYGVGYWRVRYMMRNRLVYTGAADTYTDWPSTWTNLWTSTYTPTSKVCTQEDNVYSTPLALSQTIICGSSGQYDALQLRVAVRQCDKNGNYVSGSSWETRDVTVYWVPTPTIDATSGCVVDPATGIVAITVDTGSARPASLVSLRGIMDDTTEKYVSVRYGYDEVDSDGNYVIHIDPSDGWRIREDGTYVNLYVMGADGYGGWSKVEVFRTVPASSEYLAEPVLTATETDLGLSLSVPHSTSPNAYTGVSVVYSWVDAFGKTQAGSAELVKSGSVWGGTIEATPYGSAITLTTTAEGSVSGVTVHRSAGSAITTAARENICLSYGSEAFRLEHNCKITRTVKNDTDTTQLASGRTVSRHGNARPTTYSISGTLIAPVKRGDVPSMWLSDLETTLGAHDWYVRTKEGYRFRAACTGVTVSISKDGYATVSLSLTEVDA